MIGSLRHEEECSVHLAKDSEKGIPSIHMSFSVRNSLTETPTVLWRHSPIGLLFTRLISGLGHTSGIHRKRFALSYWLTGKQTYVSISSEKNRKNCRQIFLLSSLQTVLFVWGNGHICLLASQSVGGGQKVNLFLWVPDVWSWPLGRTPPFINHAVMSDESGCPQKLSVLSVHRITKSLRTISRMKEMSHWNRHVGKIERKLSDSINSPMHFYFHFWQMQLSCIGRGIRLGWLRFEEFLRLMGRYCIYLLPIRMVEHPKSKPTQPSRWPDAPPCTVTIVWGVRLLKKFCNMFLSVLVDFNYALNWIYY